MSPDQREISRRQRILEHAESSGNVCLTCRYFGIGRATFYRWKRRYAEVGIALIRLLGLWLLRRKLLDQGIQLGKTSFQFTE